MELVVVQEIHVNVKSALSSNWKLSAKKCWPKYGLKCSCLCKDSSCNGECICPNSVNQKLKDHWCYCKKCNCNCYCPKCLDRTCGCSSSRCLCNENKKGGGSYNKIINPITRRKVDVKSKLGKQLLKNINQYKFNIILI